VDGLRKTIYEVDTEVVSTVPSNSLGNAFRPVKRPLPESEAQRVIESLRSRYRLVANSGNRNELGQDPRTSSCPVATS
jgi:Cu2+-containing amine oxidase